MSEHNMVDRLVGFPPPENANTAYMAQTPSMTLHEIADLLWARGEHAAYRALRAYTKERDVMANELREFNRGL